jgi:hypothetical protein
MQILREFRWKLEIGDPTFLGWFTCAAYAAAAVLALRVWYRQRDLLWFFVALGMMALGVNKQLDLQSLFTDIGRVASHHLGWYDQRRGLQKWFVFAVVGIVGGFGTWFVWHRHAFWMRHQLLSAGLVLIAIFVLLRMMSAYHFDPFQRNYLLEWAVNQVLELSGIFLIGLAALSEPAKSR